MKKLLAAAIAATCMTATADAAVVTKNFYLFDDLGNILTFDGQISYEETLLTMVGEELIGVADGVTMSATVDGQFFDETSDVDYPAYPELTFTDGLITDINYVLVHGVNGVDFSAYSFTEGSFTDVFWAIDENAYYVTFESFSAPAVPLPAGLPLVLTGLGALAWVRKSRKA